MQRDEFNASGTINGQRITGKVTAYPNTVRKAQSRGLKTAVIDSFSQVENNIKNIDIYNTKTLSSIVALVVTGTIIITSIVGGTFIRQKDPTPTPTQQRSQAYVAPEQTYEVIYKVVYGDSLWKIAGRYRPEGQIPAEIERIARNNDMQPKAMIREGQELRLNVPIDHLEQFGFRVDNAEAAEWTAMDYFIFKCFDVDIEEINANALPQFERDKADFHSELMNAAVAIEEYEQMKRESFLYDEEALARKKAEIDSIYLTAIERLSRNAFTRQYTYGEDFAVTVVPTIVQIEERSLTP